MLSLPFPQKEAVTAFVVNIRVNVLLILYGRRRNKWFDQLRDDFTVPSCCLPWTLWCPPESRLSNYDEEEEEEDGDDGDDG